MRFSIITTIVMLTLTVSGVVFAQEGEAKDQFVPRKEYDKLKGEFEAMKTEMRSLRDGLHSRQKVDQEFEKRRSRALTELRDEFVASLDRQREANAGSSKFLITGYAAVDFTNREGEDSTFGTMVAPLFLWKIGDNILFESEIELEVTSGSGGHGDEEAEGGTELALEYASLSYLVNDYVTVGGGLFLTPLGVFRERLHPAWINKLPDAPLGFGHGGIVPQSSLGAFVRGAVPAGTTKFNYVFYAANGPELIDEGEEAGSLDYENFTDNNNSKAFGGRIGFLLIPELEVGYSFQVARVDPADFGRTNAFIQAIDISYVKYVDCIGGIIDVRTEWVFSDVDNQTYNVAEEGDPDEFIRFTNERTAGYVQIAYRPTGSSNVLFRNLECVGRWEMLNLPNSAPESMDRQRLTLGLNYWFDASAVLKFAYQFDNRERGDEVDAFFIQAALGF